ncbi:MAG: hypothetical protein J7K36_08900 [Archaeoglobaceae archaeon]|nr:hypothetical protein [Archaeoglobaceae archaeon]
MQFSEHVKLLVLALLVFCALFTAAYTLKLTRLWISLFAVIIVLSGTIAVLARWSRDEIEQTD